MKNKRTNFIREAYYRRLVLKPRNRLSTLLPFDINIRMLSNYHRFYTDKYYRIKFNRLGLENVFFELKKSRKKEKNEK